MRPLALLSLLFVTASGASAQAPCTASSALERAPLLSTLATTVPMGTEALQAYLCAYTPEALNTTDDLLNVLTLRDTVIARLGGGIEDWYYGLDGEGFEILDDLFVETETLALRPIQAEGIVFGLTWGPLMDGVATVLAPRDLMLYLDFQAAEGGSMGGEYPYMTLDAEVDMILAGEALRREFPSSAYIGATQEAFGRALTTLAGLHPAKGEWGDDQWFAGVATTEFYPWAADKEALQRFVREASGEEGEPRSRYHAPLARILSHPPEAVETGELDLLVAATAGSREAAVARLLAMLDSGIDAVGILPRDDGSYEVIYRYYPAGDARTEAAIDWASELGVYPETVRRSADDLWGM